MCPYAGLDEAEIADGKTRMFVRPSLSCRTDAECARVFVFYRGDNNGLQQPSSRPMIRRVFFWSRQLPTPFKFRELSCYQLASSQWDVEGGLVSPSIQGAP